MPSSCPSSSAPHPRRYCGSLPDTHALPSLTPQPHEPREIDYRVLRVLERDPEISQRALAQELGISLGSVNYCLQALVRVGWVKARNFRNSRNKQAYIYKLTPEGLRAKAVAAQAFLRRKRAEYARLAEDIQALEQDVRQAQRQQG